MRPKKAPGTIGEMPIKRNTNKRLGEITECNLFTAEQRQRDQRSVFKIRDSNGTSILIILYEITAITISRGEEVIKLDNEYRFIALNFRRGHYCIGILAIWNLDIMQ